jgi:hypothetical protein
MGLGVVVRGGRGAAMCLRRRRRMSRLLEIIRCRLGTRSIAYDRIASGFTKRSADIVKNGGPIWPGDTARSEGTIGQDLAP